MLLGEVTQFLGFDTETSGVDTYNDRIVTISMVHRTDDVDDISGQVLNPGIPIPPEATAIHHITDDMVNEMGFDPKEELPIFHQMIKDAWSQGIPLVGSNVAFDLSLLDSELRRYGLEPLEIAGPILDTMVLHRMVTGEKKATLAVMSTYYGITNVTAHDSTSDVIATLDILQKMIKKSVYLQETDLRDLYTAQRVAHRNKQQNLQKFFDRIGKKEKVDFEWPLKTR